MDKEDEFTVYRSARGEPAINGRRIFYIDVGDMEQHKAQRLIREAMDKLRKGSK